MASESNGGEILDNLLNEVEFVKETKDCNSRSIYTSNSLSSFSDQDLKCLQKTKTTTAFIANLYQSRKLSDLEITFVQSREVIKVNSGVKYVDNTLMSLIFLYRLTN